MTDKTDTKKEAMLLALEASMGIVSTACKSAGISRDTHYRWLKEDEDYSKKVDEMNNVTLDFVESELHKKIKKGNLTAIIFYLKCRGKDRGYIEQQRIEHSGAIFTKTLQEVEEELESIEKQLGAIDV